MQVKSCEKIFQEQAPITNIAYSNNGEKILLDLGDLNLRLYDSKYTLRSKFPPKYSSTNENEMEITSRSLSPGGTHIIASTSDESACVYKIGTKWSDKKAVIKKFALKGYIQDAFFIKIPEPTAVFVVIKNMTTKVSSTLIETSALSDLYSQNSLALFSCSVNSPWISKQLSQTTRSHIVLTAYLNGTVRGVAISHRSSRIFYITRSGIATEETEYTRLCRTANTIRGISASQYTTAVIYSPAHDRGALAILSDPLFSKVSSLVTVRITGTVTTLAVSPCSSFIAVACTDNIVIVTLGSANWTITSNISLSCCSILSFSPYSPLYFDAGTINGSVYRISLSYDISTELPSQLKIISPSCILVKKKIIFLSGPIIALVKCLNSIIVQTSSVLSIMNLIYSTTTEILCEELQKLVVSPINEFGFLLANQSYTLLISPILTESVKLDVPLSDIRDGSITITGSNLALSKAEITKLIEKSLSFTMRDKNKSTPEQFFASSPKLEINDKNGYNEIKNILKNRTQFFSFTNTKNDSELNQNINLQNNNVDHKFAIYDKYSLSSFNNNQSTNKVLQSIKYSENYNSIRQKDIDYYESVKTAEIVDINDNDKQFIKDRLLKNIDNNNVILKYSEQKQNDSSNFLFQDKNIIFRYNHCIKKDHKSGKNKIKREENYINQNEKLISMNKIDNHFSKAEEKISLNIKTPKYSFEDHENNSLTDQYIQFADSDIPSDLSSLSSAESQDEHNIKQISNDISSKEITNYENRDISNDEKNNSNFNETRSFNSSPLNIKTKSENKYIKNNDILNHSVNPSTTTTLTIESAKNMDQDKITQRELYREQQINNILANFKNNTLTIVQQVSLSSANIGILGSKSSKQLQFYNHNLTINNVTINQQSADIIVIQSYNHQGISSSFLKLTSKEPVIIYNSISILSGFFLPQTDVWIQPTPTGATVIWSPYIPSVKMHINCGSPLSLHSNAKIPFSLSTQGYSDNSVVFPLCPTFIGIGNIASLLIKVPKIRHICRNILLSCSSSEENIFIRIFKMLTLNNEFSSCTLGQALSSIHNKYKEISQLISAILIPLNCFPYTEWSTHKQIDSLVSQYIAFDTFKETPSNILSSNSFRIKNPLRKVQQSSLGISLLRRSIEERLPNISSNSIDHFIYLTHQGDFNTILNDPIVIKTKDMIDWLAWIYSPFAMLKAENKHSNTYRSLSYDSVIIGASKSVTNQSLAKLQAVFVDYLLPQSPICKILGQKLLTNLPDYPVLFSIPWICEIFHITGKAAAFLKASLLFSFYRRIPKTLDSLWSKLPDQIKSEIQDGLTLARHYESAYKVDTLQGDTLAANKNGLSAYLFASVKGASESNIKPAQNFIDIFGPHLRLCKPDTVAAAIKQLPILPIFCTEDVGVSFIRKREHVRRRAALTTKKNTPKFNKDNKKSMSTSRESQTRRVAKKQSIAINIENTQTTLDDVFPSKKDSTKPSKITNKSSISPTKKHRLTKSKESHSTEGSKVTLDQNIEYIKELPNNTDDQNAIVLENKPTLEKSQINNNIENESKTKDSNNVESISSSDLKEIKVKKKRENSRVNKKPRNEKDIRPTSEKKSRTSIASKEKTKYKENSRTLKSRKDRVRKDSLDNYKDSEKYSKHKHRYNSKEKRKLDSRERRKYKKQKSTKDESLTAKERSAISNIRNSIEAERSNQYDEAIEKRITIGPDEYTEKLKLCSCDILHLTGDRNTDLTTLWMSAIDLAIEHVPEVVDDLRGYIAGRFEEIGLNKLAAKLYRAAGDEKTAQTSESKKKLHNF